MRDGNPIVALIRVAVGKRKTPLDRAGQLNIDMGSGINRRKRHPVNPPQHIGSNIGGLIADRHDAYLDRGFVEHGQTPGGDRSPTGVSGRRAITPNRYRADSSSTQDQRRSLSALVRSEPVWLGTTTRATSTAWSRRC